MADANCFDNDFFEDLIKDTNFVLAKTGSLMSSRKKVLTPLYAINCIYGGGIPLGVIGEISGPPGSGKSTFSYQCMANYQIAYPEGIPVIYDMESSMDDIRLGMLGVDTNKLLRLPATSMEEAFASMFAIMIKIEEKCKEFPDISSFQIYDTISTGGTNKQHEAVENGKSVMNAGGMQEAPRILKQNLGNLFPYLEKFPVFVGLLNQVFTQMGTYQSSVKSGGGFGLKHGAHFHITFGNNKDVFEDGFIAGTESMIKLEKSKLSPKFVDIPCYIDSRHGGRIDEVDSFVKYLSDSNLGIIKTGAWFNIKDTIDSMIVDYPGLEKREDLVKLGRNLRKADMYAEIHANSDLLNLLQIRLIDFINNIFPMQSLVNEDFKFELIDNCCYFDEINVVKEDKEN